MKFVRGALVISMLAMRAIVSAQGHAHQHGVLTLDIGIETSTLTMQMASPLDNLLGFEHAPRTDGERKRVDAALARLGAAQDLFAIDAAAECRLANVEITSEVLGIGTPGTASSHDQHADLGARFDFQCRDGGRTAYVDVHLFDAFAGVKRIEVQVAGPRGQLKRNLRRSERRVTLAR